MATDGSELMSAQPCHQPRDESGQLSNGGPMTRACRACGHEFGRRPGEALYHWFGKEGKRSPHVYCSYECGRGAAAFKVAGRTEKRCPTCRVLKPVGDFYARAAGSSRSASCKRCTNRASSGNRAKPHQFLRGLVKSAELRAAKKKIPFDLTVAWVSETADMQGWRCVYSGTPMTTTTGRGFVGTNISLDRVDSNRGYTVDNVAICCAAVNIAKHSGSYEELLALARKLIAQHDAKAANISKEM